MRTLNPAARAALLVLLVAFVAVPLVASDSPTAKIEDLAWMTGSWSGSLGPSTLEEHWMEPKAGSMAAMVRMAGPTATGMIELIVIEPEGESLVLRLQQFSSSFAPRSQEPQTLRLQSLETRKVTWEAAGDGAIRTLTYARPTDDTFTLSVSTAQGTFDATLEAMD